MSSGVLVMIDRPTRGQAGAGEPFRVVPADAPALRYTMPFLLDALERQQKIFGADPWPYGLTANRAALEVFADYLVEQGLTASRIEVTDLFAPSTLAESKI